MLGICNTNCVAELESILASLTIELFWGTNIGFFNRASRHYFWFFESHHSAPVRMFISIPAGPSCANTRRKEDKKDETTESRGSEAEGHVIASGSLIRNGRYIKVKWFKTNANRWSRSRITRPVDGMTEDCTRDLLHAQETSMENSQARASLTAALVYFKNHYSGRQTTFSSETQVYFACRFFA